MNIFFDLDGTLLDARMRLYLLFQHLVPASKLSFNEYWDLKKNKFSHGHILTELFSYSEETFHNFERNWMEKIELEEWLAYDEPFPGVTELLLKLKQRHELYVVTARQFESIVQQQVVQHGWADLFRNVLVTCQKQEKYDLIRNAVLTNNSDWLIGDTGKDIQTGKRLGIKTAAVLSGFMKREKLIEYKPDVILNSVLELEDIFNTFHP